MRVGVRKHLWGYQVPVLGPPPEADTDLASECEVQVLPTDAGCLNELLLRHAAELQAADVEVTEGDAVGIKLVLVTAELEPFPDMALGPVFRVH